MKAGDEIQSLSRFTSTQRTAFRKLLKKARKWTRSDNLANRFNANVLNDSKSFTKLDFQPLLDDYSETLHNIRTLYADNMKRASPNSKELSEPASESSVTQRLRAALATGSKVEFDTAIATIPLGDHGDVANYFVHPEYVVELQILLLQHMQYHTPKSRQDSLARTPSSDAGNGIPNKLLLQDNFMLVADDLERFAQLEGALTVNEREHLSGSVPQKAKHLLRWNNEEDAILASRVASAKVRTASLRRKYAEHFFDAASLSAHKSEVAFADEELGTIRKAILKDKSVRPLYKISSSRSRFTGIHNESEGLVLATLDTNVSMGKANTTASSDEFTNFPFAILQVRKEGTDAEDLISILDKSHLVERVRGFSLQYHALWQVCKPSNISPPFWIPILSRDIRKMPPPAKSRKGSGLAPGSGSHSATNRSTGTNSVRGLTDETTAVDTTRPSSGANIDSLQTPPLSSFRKKRKRKYPSRSKTDAARERYWSEYDNPEDGEGDNAYVIYIDPNERSTLERLFDRVGSLFSTQQPEPDADISSPGTPKDDETSSDEDEESALHPSQQNGYGTLPYNRSASRTKSTPQESLPQVTTICLAASVAILIITFILAMTAKHKYARTVDTAIIFAIVCSLVFAVTGFASLMGLREKRRSLTWFALGLAAGILLVDAICSGALLAWMLG